MLRQKRKPHITLRSKLKIGKSVCELYALGEFTIATCCEAAGIKYDTFKEWVQAGLNDEDIALKNYRRGFVKELHKLYLNAQEQNNINYKKLLKDKTRTGILERITGSKITETQISTKMNKDGSASTSLIRKIERYVPPDTSMLIFIANTLNIFGTNTSTKRQEFSDYKSIHLLTDDELKNKIIELEQTLLSDKDY